jgi:excisionase family DNA binding protein
VSEDVPPKVVSAPDDRRARILTVEQAAELLSVRPKTVRALAAGGVIPAVKVGKPWRFDEGLLLEWLRSRAAENVTAAPRAPPYASVATVRVNRTRTQNDLGARLDRMLAEPPTHTEPKQRARPGVRP